MTGAKGIHTPMVSNLKLSKYGSDYLADTTFYNSIACALQYATITRPKINFAVNSYYSFLRVTGHL